MTSTYNQVTDIYLMPINGIEITRIPIIDVSNPDTGPSPSFIYIHQLEGESSYRITPKTRNDSKGNVRTLGYNIEITAYIPYNDYKNIMLSELGELPHFTQQDSFTWHFDLVIGGKLVSEPEHGIINTTIDKGFMIRLSNSSITIEIENVELRPRLILKTNQFVKNINNVII